MIKNEQWTRLNGQWTMNDERSINEQWLMNDEQWTRINDQWIMQTKKGWMVNEQ